jgi:hypothetical protein
MKFLGRKTVKADKTSAPMVKTSGKAAAKGQVQAAEAKRKRSPTHDEIAVRSYELYLARAGAPGSSEPDGLEAERQLSE